MKKSLARQFVLYFFRGLLLIAPIFATVYSILAIINWLDTMFGIPSKTFFGERLNLHILPGTGVIIFVLAVFIIGYYSSSYIFQWIVEFIEGLVMKNTLTRVIYTSIKDMMQAFVGDKKSFSNPVMFKMSTADECWRVGFITATQLAAFGLEDHVGVFMPQAYAFAGHLLLVPKENIKPIQHLPSADVMKFAVSGGVSYKDTI